MQCPKCKTEQLAEKSLKEKDLALNQCPRCRGLWFDRGELATVLGQRSADDIAVPKISLQNDNCRCPRCNNGMYEFCYPRTAVFVDMCASCGGIWLDNKEWKEIAIARSEKNKIICPKCGTKQTKSPHCQHCGIVFAKYDKSEDSKSNDNTDTETKAKQESYADDIPGIKGALLRFIDRSVDKLTQY